jgi:hypothetical protein
VFVVDHDVVVLGGPCFGRLFELRVPGFGFVFCVFGCFCVGIAFFFTTYYWAQSSITTHTITPHTKKDAVPPSNQTEGPSTVKLKCTLISYPKAHTTTKNPLLQQPKKTNRTWYSTVEYI